MEFVDQIYMFYTESILFAKPPVVPGHELAAYVVEVGSEVTSVKVGDHVTLDPIMACMQCPACLSGRFNLCEPPHVAGFRAPGFAKIIPMLFLREIAIRHQILYP